MDELPCVLCGSNEKEDLVLGEFGLQDASMLHRNCLILCIGKSVQNRTASFRLWNFVKKDIIAEKNRCELVSCDYCPRLGANLYCSHPGCKRNYHTKCGVDNMAVLQYGGGFETLCAEHVPQHRKNPGPEEHCVLCLAVIVPEGKKFSTAMAFQAPCCQNGWFHRRCVQDQAMATTYYFKCPLCRNEDDFAEVAMLGVAVPKWRYSLPKPQATMAMRVTRSVTRNQTAAGRLAGRAPRVRIARLPN